MVKLKAKDRLSWICPVAGRLVSCNRAGLDDINKLATGPAMPHTGWMIVKL